MEGVLWLYQFSTQIPITVKFIELQSVSYVKQMFLCCPFSKRFFKNDDFRLLDERYEI